MISTVMSNIHSPSFSSSDEGNRNKSYQRQLIYGIYCYAQKSETYFIFNTRIYLNKSSCFYSSVEGAVLLMMATLTLNLNSVHVSPDIFRTYLPDSNASSSAHEETKTHICIKIKHYIAKVLILI